jgi:Protein  of unknown function (DUF3018)
MGVHERMTGAERVARHRAAKRAQGLRLKQFWVPDLRNPEVLEQLRRSVEIINASDRRDGVMGYINSLNDEMLNSLPPYEWDEEPEQ